MWKPPGPSPLHGVELALNRAELEETQAHELAAGSLLHYSTLRDVEAYRVRVLRRDAR